MNLIPQNEITIPNNRLRREFDPMHILGLQQSILDKGLLHPIVLRNDGKTLVSGERRLRALTELHRSGKPFRHDGQEIPRDAIPYVRLMDLTPIQLLEAEYEENAIRLDLSWVEKTAALAGLHKLRAAQKEGTGKVQTLVATASEIAGRLVAGQPARDVRNALLLDNFRTDPDVMGAKSAKEAVNIAERKTAAEFHKKAAADFQAVNVVSPHIALHNSCTAITLDEGQFDVIITDPPYGINAHKMAPLSGSNAGTEHLYEDTPEVAQVLMEWICSRGFQLCKPQAALYIFCDFRWLGWLQACATEHGWTPWPTPIIAIKPSGGMIGDSSHGPRKAYECVFFAYKGDKRTTGTFFDYFTMEQSNSKFHAANKPVSAYVELLRRSSTPGMSIFDPCMGSGTIFPAANRLSLKATGVEVDKAHFGVAISRLNSKD